MRVLADWVDSLGFRVSDVLALDLPACWGGMGSGLMVWEPLRVEGVGFKIQVLG